MFELVRLDERNARGDIFGSLLGHDAHGINQGISREDRKRIKVEKVANLVVVCQTPEETSHVLKTIEHEVKAIGDFTKMLENPPSFSRQSSRNSTSKVNRASQ